MGPEPAAAFSNLDQILSDMKALKDDQNRLSLLLKESLEDIKEVKNVRIAKLESEMLA